MPTISLDLEPGDIFLAWGGTIVSALIESGGVVQQLAQGVKAPDGYQPPSHTGMVTDSGGGIIEAGASGTAKGNLYTEYKDVPIRVWRIGNLLKEEQDQVVQVMQDSLGLSYGYIPDIVDGLSALFANTPQVAQIGAVINQVLLTKQRNCSQDIAFAYDKIGLDFGGPVATCMPSNIDIWALNNQTRPPSKIEFYSELIFDKGLLSA